MIWEFSLSEPKLFQIKYYAPGVGNMRVRWRGADDAKEDLEFAHLDRQVPAELRAETLDLEEQAYQISKEVYDQTPPAEIIPPIG